MLTQFFGNYLLQKNIINSGQLMKALEYKKNSSNKLGSLAVNAGYMTETEVEDVHSMQTRLDKRFAELAIQLGYLTSQQAEELLKMQKFGYVMLGNAIITLGFTDESVINDAISSYEKEFNLDPTNILNAGQSIIEEMVSKFYGLNSDGKDTYVRDYATLLIKDIIRFIGSDCSLLAPIHVLPDIVNPTTSYQMIVGTFSSSTCICADGDTFAEFAARYAGQEFENDKDFINASVSDFLNLHNGLFTVNTSNNYNVELELKPPYEEDEAPETTTNSYIIPIQFTFGVVYFIFTV